MNELSKEAKLEKVSLLIVKEYLLAPHKKLNIQKIAVEGNVSRPWIYKYFGSTEKDIILTTIDGLASQLTETSMPEKVPTNGKDWAKHFLKGINTSLLEVEGYPDVFRFYMLTKLYPSEFSERFKFHEELYLQKRAVPLIRQAFGFSTADARTMAEMIHALRIGVAMKWLLEENKSPANRAKIIQTIKVRVFDQFTDFQQPR
jgi:hypothetical protein